MTIKLLPENASILSSFAATGSSNSSGSSSSSSSSSNGSSGGNLSRAEKRIQDQLDANKDAEKKKEKMKIASFFQPPKEGNRGYDVSAESVKSSTRSKQIKVHVSQSSLSITRPDVFDIDADSSSAPFHSSGSRANNDEAQTGGGVKHREVFYVMDDDEGDDDGDALKAPKPMHVQRLVSIQSEKSREDRNEHLQEHHISLLGPAAPTAPVKRGPSQLEGGDVVDAAHGQDKRRRK